MFGTKISLLFLGLMFAFAGLSHAVLFINNGDGTVNDDETGLIWQQMDDGVTRTWESAIVYCNQLSLGGNNDWRLPNIKELESIVAEFVYDPAIDPVFVGTKSLSYWSASSNDSAPVYAWNVHFARGTVLSYYKSDNYYVRCVR